MQAVSDSADVDAPFSAESVRRACRNRWRHWEVLTLPESFQAVHDALTAKNISIEVEEIAMIPQTSVKLTGKQAKQMLKLMTALEDLEDLTNVWANFDIDEEEIEAAMSN